MAWLIGGKISLMEQMRRTLEDSRIIVAVSGMIHELQKERGLGFTLLDGGRNQIETRLITQRRLTDSALARLKTKISDVGAENLGKPAALSLRKAGSALEELPQYRARVSAGLTEAEPALAYYSEIIRLFLDALHKITDHVPHPRIAHYLAGLNTTEG